ncbi:MAG: hypothetical protein KIT60_14420 [Burkholderiaceae bacterium]|nr:hypothetical protein [Burkholderiaceae bacterium]
MNPVGYDTILANISKVDVNGAQVEVTWRCPVTGHVVGSSTATMAADPSVAGKVLASVKRSIASEVVYGAARFVTSLLGGAAGRVVSNAAYTAAGDINSRVTSGVDYSDDSRQAAIMAAFETIRPSFAWDEQRRQFVAR